MKTFIVTGCNGYIGSHMCYELRRVYTDCHIIGVDKNARPHLRHLYDDYCQLDISYHPVYTDYTGQYLGEKRIDAIFHFAAYISVEEGELEPWKYYRNNVGSLISAIDTAQHYNIKNFIFSSTAAVYGLSLIHISEPTRPY